MSEKIFVALSTFAREGMEPLKLLRTSGHPFEINPTGKRLTSEQLMEMAGGFEGIVAGLEPYNAEVLRSLPDLKCISRCGVGIDNIDQKEARCRGIAIRNTPDVVAQPVAELVVALMFDLLRRLTWHTSLLKQKCWEKKTGHLIEGKKAGVLGLGLIGRRTALMMKKLGMDVYGVDICPDEQWAKENGITLISQEELLSTVDVISIHLSHKGGKSFCLGKTEIAGMKPGAVVINTSRGCFIDEDALYEALQNGHLDGAGLDVYQEEPYAGKLCDLDNVVLTPHVATLTKESRVQMEYAATKNLIDYFAQNKA